MGDPAVTQSFAIPCIHRFATNGINHLWWMQPYRYGHRRLLRMQLSPMRYRRSCPVEGVPPNRILTVSQHLTVMTPHRSTIPSVSWSTLKVRVLTGTMEAKRFTAVGCGRMDASSAEPSKQPGETCRSPSVQMPPPTR